MNRLMLVDKAYFILQRKTVIRSKANFKTLTQYTRQLAFLDFNNFRHRRVQTLASAHWDVADTQIHT